MYFSQKNSKPWYGPASVPHYHICTACWEISISLLTTWCKTFR